MKAITTKRVSNAEFMKPQFLYAAIADAQGTIRATDAKTGVLMVMLAIPLTRFGSIYSKCDALLGSNKYVSHVSAVLIFIFAVLWVLSFIASMRSIIAIDDPSRHVDGKKPSGIFYSGGLFSPTFLDAILNRPILAKRQLDQQICALPESEEELIRELIFEHAKLVYIRSIKMVRMKYAFVFGISWVFLGGIIWLMDLVSR